jgi:hypothetical protein
VLEESTIKSYKDLINQCMEIIFQKENIKNITWLACEIDSLV